MKKQALFLSNGLIIPERFFLDILKAGHPSKWADLYTGMFAGTIKSVQSGTNKLSIRLSDIGANEQIKLEV